MVSPAWQDRMLSKKNKTAVHKLLSYSLIVLFALSIFSQSASNPLPAVFPTPTHKAAVSATTQPISIANIKSPTAPLPTLAVETATPTHDPQFLRPDPGSICGYDPAIEELIASLQQSDWASWIEVLSGEKPAQMNGETYTIQTRYSESLFDGTPHARAYEFVINQLREWGYEDNIDLLEQRFKPSTDIPTSTWKNIIVVIPGSDPDLANEEILLTAHLDSTSTGNPESNAPGADDNGSGVATLLEAARIFRGKTFKHTIKIIFFTGEEQGLHGSRAYVSRYKQDLKKVIGVFNLDMFGYDADNDRCFEIHVGWMKASNKIGGCLADIIEEYQLDLKFDYLVDQARGSSDHVSFWMEGVGAIEVLENFDTHGYEDGCGESDINPNYHTEQDRIEAMNLDAAHTIAKSAIGAVARLAGLVEK